ncbi:hypothetical protein YC2023_061608 [Brassica napus]
MTRISDLSQDLIEEILSRVPLTSQRAARSTCKLDPLANNGMFFGSGFGRGETCNWAGVGDMSSKDVVGYRGVKLVLKITNPFIKARN